jgi:cytochrome c556
MNIAPKISKILGAGIGFALLAACGGMGGQQFDPESPEGEAYLYREAIMTLVADKMATIGGMAREEIPLDEAKFVKATKELAALSGMLLEGFEIDVVVDGSRSLPDIWANRSDFEQKAMDFETAAGGLAAAAESGGFASAQGLVQGTAGTCGGCHRSYRQRTE